MIERRDCRPHRLSLSEGGKQRALIKQISGDQLDSVLEMSNPLKVDSAAATDKAIHGVALV